MPVNGPEGCSSKPQYLCTLLHVTCYGNSLLSCAAAILWNPTTVCDMLKKKTDLQALQAAVKAD